MAVSSGPSGALAVMRAVCRSCNPLVSHSRVSWARLSAIELPALCENLVLQRSAQILVAIEFFPRLDKHVFAQIKVAEAMMRPLHPADRSEERRVGKECR